MRTVKEISQITGISVRTLHYYDEIGLLAPTAKSEAGYRLYDDKALETLRQILFFREFDIPLRKIRSLITSPDLDENEILLMQREMLTAKRNRISRLIDSIDNILKGAETMDFEVFTETDIKDMFQAMVDHMTEDQKEIFIKEHGSMDEFQNYFLESASTDSAQKNFQKVSEWYGSKRNAMNAVTNPASTELFSTYQKRLGSVLEKLAAKKDCNVHSFDVKELVNEYDFVSKQLYQMDDLTQMMLEMAQFYLTDRQMQDVTDKVYGEGTSEFFGLAFRAFYSKE